MARQKRHLPQRGRAGETRRSLVSPSLLSWSKRQDRHNKYQGVERGARGNRGGGGGVRACVHPPFGLPPIFNVNRITSRGDSIR
jgi:hypothetical protein